MSVNYSTNANLAVDPFLTNSAGNVILARGTFANLPTGAGYAIGCEYQATDTGVLYTNVGTATAASFVVGGGSSASQRVTTQTALTSVNILALNATPITLVAAPGAGKVIVVRGITFRMDSTATQYAAGGALEFRYTNASGAKVTADIAASVVQAGAGTSYTSVAGVTTSLTNVVNSPIVINNATAAFTTGTGTANITVVYDIITA